MNRNVERRRNFIGSIIFLVLIFLLIVGGYFLTKYFSSDEKKQEALQSEVDLLKVEPKKDLVYYTNVDNISSDPEIVYKDIVINLHGADILNETLKKKMDSIRTSVKKINEAELDRSRDILFEEGGIFSAQERNYAVYESSDYLSVLVVDSNFDCYNGSQISEINSYNFSLSTGKQLSNETVLGFFDLSIDDVKNKVREKLNADQSDMGDQNVIQIDNTINAITEDNANLYISKTGKLMISIIVKTQEESYNDSVVLS